MNQRYWVWHFWLWGYKWLWHWHERLLEVNMLQHQRRESLAIKTWRHCCGYRLKHYNLSASDNMTVLKVVVTLSRWTHQQSFTVSAARLFFGLKGLVGMPRHISIFVSCSLCFYLLTTLNHHWCSGLPILIINHAIQLKCHLAFVCLWYRA